MKQIIPRCGWGAGFVNGTQFLGVIDGEGNIPNSDTFGHSWYRAPLPIAGTARNLVVYSRDARHGTTTVTLMKNGVATALAATLASGDSVSPVGVGEIAYALGDDWSYRISGPSGLGSPPYFGYDIGMSLEYEAAGSVYNITPVAGGKAVGRGYIGGALGNGFWENYDTATPVTLSTSYSICAVAGAVTGLTIRAYDGAPGAGIWTGYLQLNGVLQDGSGGTVNTAVVLTGTDTVASSAFTLPVAIKDHVDAVVIRTGIDAPFANAQIGAGIAFTPTTDGQFMLCGGSNDTISAAAQGWKWTRSDQLATPEIRNLAPVGPLGFRAIGLYVERGQAPGNTRSFTHTLRQNEGSTIIAVTIANLLKVGEFTSTPVEFAPGDIVDLQIDPVNSPVSGGFYWGLAATAIPPTATLVVRKITDPDTDTTTEFTFTVDGGLTPSPFVLRNGESQTFAEIPFGTYAVEELGPPTDWTLASATVDNGDPVSAIVIDTEDEVVTATFLNQYGRPGCPPGNLEPRAVTGLDGCPVTL